MTEHQQAILVAIIERMIYIDNLCEFIRLIVQNQDNGIFYPQNQDYVNTSQLVKEIKRRHLLPAV